MVPRSLRCSDPSSLFGAEDLFFCPGGSAKTAFPFFENYEEVNIVKEALNNILAAAKAELEQAQDAKALEDVRVRYLGKKGELTAILKQMGSLSAEERPVIGQLANQVRAEIETLLAETGAELKEKALEKRLMEERLDVTLPGKKQVIGQLGVSGDNRECLFLGLGKSYLHYNRYDTLPEVFAQIEKITAGQILEVANEVLAPERLFCLIYE